MGNVPLLVGYIPLPEGDVPLLVGAVPLLVGAVPLLVGAVPLLVGDVPFTRPQKKRMTCGVRACSRSDCPNRGHVVSNSVLA